MKHDGIEERAYTTVTDQVGKASEPAQYSDGNCCGRDFSFALRALKNGKRIARYGWSGIDTWLAYSPGHPGLQAEKFWSDANRGYALLRGGRVGVHPCITMKDAHGDIMMGWTASQLDLLAEDWYIVE